MKKVSVECRNIRLSYGKTEVLKDVNIHIEPGEFFALLGPSGSGKSTLLRLIAGFNRHSAGQLLVDGKDITGTPPWDRNIGMVFQNYALWPHMTVWDNVAFGLVERKLPRAEIRAKVEAALELVGLSQYGKRRPNQLSGGQQQRVALARTIVIEPQVLLLDEPLSNLDKKLRVQMRQDLLSLQRRLGITTIFVTHDQEEAMTMSDRICLMNGGAIEQLGTPADLYFRPRTLFVADFLGESNLLQGEVTAVDGDVLSVTLAHQGVTGQALSNGAPIKPGQKVTVMLRPQNLRVATSGSGLTGKLLDVMVTGSLTKLYLDLGVADAAPIVVAYPTQRQAEQYAIGQPLTVSWQAADAVAIAE
ncbi:MAG TPA: spermidine/putrescine ABC transporter ATP-binding protein [Achromobacter sp.]|nr:spermidine/putrescine ABC transporter ATP-binding protein [Achromobacter sp.]